MPDTLQLVELVGGYPHVIRDLNRVDLERGQRLERDTLSLPGGTRKPRWTELPGRHGGARLAGESRDNATLGATFHLRGGDHDVARVDETVEELADLLASVDVPDMTGRWLMFRPEGAGAERTTLYRCMGPADWSVRYIKNALLGGNVLGVAVTVPVKPKAYGLPYTFVESFDVTAAGLDPVRTNELLNPRFRDTLDGWEATNATSSFTRPSGANWSTGNGAPDNRGGYMTGIPSAPTNSARIVGQGEPVRIMTPEGSSSPYRCKPGDVIRLTGNAFLTTPGAGAGPYFNAGISFFTGSGGFVSGSGTQVLGNTGGHKIIDVSATAPAGAERFNVAVHGKSTGANMDFEIGRMMVEINGDPALPNHYLDGDAELGVWEGARHASRSLIYPDETDPLDKWTFTSGEGFIRRSAGGALRGNQASGQGGNISVLYHEGAAYQHADFEWIMQGVYTRSAGSHAVVYGVGKLVGTDDYVIGSVLDNPPSNTTRVRLDAYSGGGTSVFMGELDIARLNDNTPFWLRVRGVGNSWSAALYTTDPDKGGTPLEGDVISANLPSHYGQIMGAGVPGVTVLRLQPQDDRDGYEDWAIEEIRVRPIAAPGSTSANAAIDHALHGNVPGDASLRIRQTAGNRPKFALVTWRRKRPDHVETGIVPWGILPDFVGDGFNTSVGGAVGGTVRRLGLLSAGGTFLCYVDVRADNLAGDPYDRGVVPIAIWLGAFIPSTAVTPRFAVGVESIPGTTATRLYSVDGGPQGRAVVLPSSGTPRRFFPLGVVNVDRQVAATQRLFVLLTYGPGSSGNLDLDYFLAAPVRQSASSPVGKAATVYPDFLPVVNTVKDIATDLSARTWGTGGPASAVPSPGLGGAPLEIEPGDIELLVKTSDLIPDDPVASSSSEEVTQTFDAYLDFQPCYSLLRNE